MSAVGEIHTAVMLCDPKLPRNYGAIVRTAACYGVPLVIAAPYRRLRDRIELAMRKPRELRMKEYAGVERHLRGDAQAALDDPDLAGHETVCVELAPGALPLALFRHPRRATYVFGPEDGDVPQAVRRRCQHFVYIPMAATPSNARLCLSLPAAVATVLYDRFERGKYG